VVRHAGPFAPRSRSFPVVGGGASLRAYNPLNDPLRYPQGREDRRGKACRPRSAHKGLPHTCRRSEKFLNESHPPHRHWPRRLLVQLPARPPHVLGTAAPPRAARRLIAPTLRSSPCYRAGLKGVRDRRRGPRVARRRKRLGAPPRGGTRAGACSRSPAPAKAAVLGRVGSPRRGECVFGSRVLSAAPQHQRTRRAGKVHQTCARRAPPKRRAARRSPWEVTLDCRGRGRFGPENTDGARARACGTVGGASAQGARRTRLKNGSGVQRVAGLHGRAANLGCPPIALRGDAGWAHESLVRYRCMHSSSLRFSAALLGGNPPLAQQHNPGGWRPCCDGWRGLGGPLKWQPLANHRCSSNPVIRPRQKGQLGGDGPGDCEAMTPRRQSTQSRWEHARSTTAVAGES
jgi:hypothetical protein